MNKITISLSIIMMCLVNIWSCGPEKHREEWCSGCICSTRETYSLLCGPDPVEISGNAEGSITTIEVQPELILTLLLKKQSDIVVRFISRFNYQYYQIHQQMALEKENKK